MILKAGQVSSRLGKSDTSPWCALVFGDDDGVVNDLADEIADVWTNKASGAARQITLDDDDIRREPHLLSDRIETGSLLGEVEIVRVRTSGEKISKPVLDLIARADQMPAGFANRLLVLNGSLNKRSKLRTTIEQSKSAAAIQVYSDTTESLKSIVQDKLATFDVEIAPEALEDFVGLLPGHRGLANQETEKLALYGKGLGRPLSVSDVREVCRTDAEDSVRDLAQAALSGEPDRTQAEYERVIESGTTTISVLRVLEMEIRRLLQARGLLGTGGDIGKRLRPPVWGSEWPAFRARLDLWSATSLTRLLSAVHDMEMQAKTAGAASDPALRLLLLDIVRSAAVRRKQV